MKRPLHVPEERRGAHPSADLGRLDREKLVDPETLVPDPVEAQQEGKGREREERPPARREGAAPPVVLGECSCPRLDLLTAQAPLRLLV